MHRLPETLLLGLSVAAATFSSQAAPPAPPLVKFNGTIGVDPVASLNVATTNVVRGINPGGRHWVLRKLKATVGTDGSINAVGAGLLFGSGDLIGTRGTVANVVATLACGAANATASLFTSPPAALDQAGDFYITGVLSQDGINAAVMPSTCENPVLLIRSFNAASPSPAGNWFAAGIPKQDDD